MNKKRILIVEDQVILAMTEQQALNRYNYEVTYVTTGEEAVELVRNKNDAIDLILMDIDLGSGIDGTEAARQILEYKEIPIVFLSSHEEPEIVEKTEKISSYGYVVKSSSMTVLDASIKMAFKLFGANQQIKKREEALKNEKERLKEHIEIIEKRKRIDEQRNKHLLELYDKVDLSQPDILDYVLNASLEITNSQFAFSGLIDEDETLMTIHRWSTEAMQDCSITDKPIEFPIEKAGIWGDCIRERKPIVINDYQNSDRTTKHGTPKGHVSINRFLCVPIFHETKIVAVGAVANKELPYDNADADALAILYDKTWSFLKQQKADRQLQESEQKWRSLVESNPDFIAIHDEAGRFLYMNRYAEGFSEEDVIGKSAYEYMSEESKQLFQQKEKECLETWSVQKFEHRAAGDKGIFSWYENILVPFVENETEKRVIVVSRDITERKQLEQSLKEDEQKLSNIIDNSTTIFYSHTPEHILTYVSPQIETILGYTPEEAMINWSELVSDHPINTEGFHHTVRAIETGERQPPYQLEVVKKTGEKVWVEVRENPVVEDGKTVAIVGSITDITEQKVTLDELRNITENMFDMVSLVNSEGEFIYISPSHEKVLGYTPEFLKGRNMIEFVHPEDLQDTLTAISKLKETKSTIKHELRYKTEKGEYIWIEAIGKVHNNDSNKTAGLFISSRDITERKLNEVALEESETRFKTLHNASFGGIIIHDQEKILDCNKGLSDITGYSYDELIGMNGLLLFSPDWRQFALENINSGYGEPYEAEGLRKDGSIFPLRIQGKNIPYNGKEVRVAEFRDITDQKKAEQQQILLNTAFTDMLELNDKQELYDYIITQLHLMYPETYVVYLSVNESKSKVRVETIKGLEYGSLSRIATIFGYNLLGKEYEIDERMNPVFYTGKVTYLKQGIIELSSTVIPSIIARQVQKIAGIKETYAIGILKDKQLIGAIHIFSRKSSELKHNNAFVESFVNQAGVILHKNQLASQLRSSLKEKDYLMKELNHRVKNNLLMVSSLISLKGAERGINLSDIQHQIEAIGLIHEKLYQNQSVTVINCEDYFEDLLNSVFSSFTKREVRLDKSIEDIRLPTKTATSLGLVINEIATNTIKHGFTDKDDAVFSIKFKKNNENNQYELILSNSGKPFPADVDIESTKTLGLRLINALVSQLNGTVELKKKPNPMYTIRFPVEK